MDCRLVFVLLISVVYAADNWCSHKNQYLGGYTAGGRKAYPSLERAQAKCLELKGGCGGITKEPQNKNDMYSLRKGTELKNSPSQEISYLRGACESEEEEEVGVAEEAVEKLLSAGLGAEAASQSSTGWQGAASRAIDGNSDGSYWANSCTHSGAQSNNWWEVNLGRAKSVSRVVISNRADCCQNRIGGAKVYVDAVFCGEVAYEAGLAKFTVNCDGAVGSVVKVVQNDNWLTLCEVEIYGFESGPASAALSNVALGKVASMTGVGWGGVAARGNDGNIAGSYWANSCTHSANAGANSWQVDLLGPHAIDTVVIHGRKDCCQDRLNGAQVFVDDVLCGTVAWNSAQFVYPIKCDKEGSIVKISQNGQYLTLCEVEVIGVRGEEEEEVVIPPSVAPPVLEVEDPCEDPNPCGENGECFADGDSHSCQCHERYELVDGVCTREAEPEPVGSASVEIVGRKALRKPKRVNKKVLIKCKVAMENIKLEKPKDPNNVEWYRVIDGRAGEKMVNGGAVQLKFSKGLYKLFFKNVQASDAGTYRCVFHHGNVNESDDVTFTVAEKKKKRRG